MATASKSSIPPAPTWHNRPDDPEYDALTELFLGDAPAAAGAGPSTSDVMPRAERADRSAQDRAPGSARIGPAGHASDSTARNDTGRAEIESLVMGHLPFRSGPWGAQYTREVARRNSETVALVRVLHGETSIDLFGLGWQGSAGSPDERPESLADAIAIISDDVDRWVLQADDVDEPLLAGDLTVDTVTLLSGVNEAAIVAAYRTIKGLMTAQTTGEPDDDAPESEPARSRPHLQIAMIGADEDRAAEASAKLRRAVEVFLGEPVGEAPSVGKIGPTGGVSVYRGPTDIPAERVIELLGQHASRRQPSMRVSRSAPAVQPTIRVASAPSPAPRAPAVAESSPVVAPSAAESTTSNGAAGRAVRTGPPLHSAVPTQSLSTFIAGLTSLGSLCPDDDHTELAMDAHGSLHILRLDQDGGAVSALTGVAAWAVRHHKLLSKATPGLKLDGSREPAMHLFTQHPKEARSILDADVRVHLLASVEVEGRTGWFCTELN